MPRLARHSWLPCSYVLMRTHHGCKPILLCNTDFLGMQDIPQQQEPTVAAEEPAETNTDADVAAEGAEEEQDATDGDLMTVAQLQLLTKVSGWVQQHLLPVCWVCHVL